MSNDGCFYNKKRWPLKSYSSDFFPPCFQPRGTLARPPGRDSCLPCFLSENPLEMRRRCEIACGRTVLRVVRKDPETSRFSLGDRVGRNKQKRDAVHQELLSHKVVTKE
jgi:hypothetical protein